MNKLEAGKYYRIRNGTKIYIFDKDPFSDIPIYCGILEGDNRNSRLFFWKENGDWLGKSTPAHWLDIIEEWKYRC